MTTRVFAVLFCLFVFSTPVFAQTNPVPAGQPFTVAFDHSGQNVTGFQCVLDGKPSGSVLAITARTCVIPGQAAGAHTVAVEAINAFGRAISPPLTVTAGTAPQPPGNLRVEVVTTASLEIAPDGTVTLIAARTEVK